MVLLDANHSKSAREDLGLLCDWPQNAAAPLHFSAFAARAQRGLARAALFAQEEQFQQQEDWNLLYVAMTRARRILLVSGVDDARAPDDSWYRRLDFLPQPEQALLPVLSGAEATTQHSFAWPLFSPPQDLPPAPPPPADDWLPLPEMEHEDSDEDSRLALNLPLPTPAQEEGIALHALLERVAQMAWPPRLPSAHALAQSLPCKLAVARSVLRQAQAILGAVELQRFFDPAAFVRADNELEILADGVLHRIDRLVEFADALWVLDYKRHVSEPVPQAYREQVQTYRHLVQRLYPQRAVYCGLISGDGRYWPIDT